MAYYCNENVKLRVGGRKAPKGGKEKLEWLLEKDSQGVNQKLYEFINQGTYEDDKTGKRYPLDKISEKFQSDLKYDIDCENAGDDAELKITKSGVYYISTWMCGDWELPVQIFIYWDGKNYRGYVPTKGNCINLLNKSAFGNDEDEDDKYCQKEFGKDYGDISDDIDIDMAACIEDFETRLEVEDANSSQSDVRVKTEQNSKEPKREYSIQITTPEESLNLLKLGVPIQSADHLYHNPFSELRREIIYIDDDVETKETIAGVGEFDEKSDFIPAWSSSRMIELYLKEVNTEVTRADYIVSGATMNNMKDNIYLNLVKQLNKAK